jgi:hypothetical protein
MAEVTAASVAGAEECVNVYNSIHNAIKDGSGWKDDTWECLVDTMIKKDLVKAWRQLEPATGLYKFRVYGVRISHSYSLTYIFRSYLWMLI